MNKKEHAQRYYRKHRDEIIAKTRAYIAEHPEMYRKQALAYYYAHREERLAYYHRNKQDILRKNQQHRRQTVITYHGERPNILNVQKAPYPANKQCTCCKKPNRRLQWHHWDDDNPEHGIWLCPKCHFNIHRLFKNPI